MKKLLYSIVSVILAAMLSVLAFAAVPGDVNGDEKVSIVDALLIAHAVVNGRDLDGADINEDGKLNLLDLVNVLKLCTASVDEKTDKATATVVGADGKVAEEVTLVGNTVTADVPVDVALEDDVTELTLSVTSLAVSQSGVDLEEGEAAIAVDVHVEGVSADNTVPIIVTISDWCEGGYNKGNLAVYHVEESGTVEMTEVDSIDELTEHNTYYYNAEDGTITIAIATFSEVSVVAKEDKAWEGEYVTSWYTENPAADSFIIANADELAGFAQIVGGMAEGIEQDSFTGKTVTLVNDVNLDDTSSENNKVFYPIGYYNSTKSYTKEAGVSVTSDVNSFEGTFDGAGHTIANFYQNTWEMFGDYNSGYSGTPNHYKDAMGLFGYVVNGTVKNLTVDNFSSDGEFTPTGVIAAYSKNSTYENIAITNCNPRVYNTGNGGIVGIGGESSDTEADKLTFTNITIDNSNKITALWGSWDVACGGLVGMFRGAGHAYMTNCHVAAQIDVYNDVCGNYQYYWYRYSGMMIGTNKNMVTDANGYTVPETSKYHAKDCTVHFGEWNDYYYCELVANSLAAYTHDHQFSRLTEVDSVDVENLTVTVGDSTTAIPTSGRYNYVVVNGEDSTENATCYHFVNGKVWNHGDAGYESTDVDGDGVIDSDLLKEDRQHYYLPFNQLFTGYGWGVEHIPVYNGEDYAFEGITILDRVEATSEVKFEAKYADYETYLYRVGNGNAVTVGTLFNAISDDISTSGVYVTVDRVDENDTVSGTYTANASDWTKGTIKFTGTGVVTITIQDYEYCTPTEIFVEIVDATNVTNANVATATNLENVAVLEDIEGTCEVNYSGLLYGNNFSFRTGTVYIGNATVDDFVIE